MKTINRIFITLVSAILLLACKMDASACIKKHADAAREECAYLHYDDDCEDECVACARLDKENNVGNLPAPCQIVAHGAESCNSANGAYGRRLRFSSLTGGRLCAFISYVRSAIHPSTGGFVLCTTTPVYSFASRTYYIYVLRHIIR